LPILLLRKRKLRHSLGRPSRSDFVQLIVIVYPLTTYCSTGLVIAAEFDVSSNVTLTCKGTSNSA
jgi:hypothetical protein